MTWIPLQPSLVLGGYFYSKKHGILMEHSGECFKKRFSVKTIMDTFIVLEELCCIQLFLTLKLQFSQCFCLLFSVQSKLMSSESSTGIEMRLVSVQGVEDLLGWDCDCATDDT